LKDIRPIPGLSIGSGWRLIQEKCLTCMQGWNGHQADKGQSSVRSGVAYPAAKTRAASKKAQNGQTAEKITVGQY